MDIIAWTGGSKPRKLMQCSKEERKLRSLIFYESMVMVWDYWGDYRGLNKTALDTARILYNRARYDAHATFRHEGE